MYRKMHFGSFYNNSEKQKQILQFFTILYLGVGTTGLWRCSSYVPSPWNTTSNSFPNSQVKRNLQLYAEFCFGKNLIICFKLLLKQQSQQSSMVIPDGQWNGITRSSLPSGRLVVTKFQRVLQRQSVCSPRRLHKPLLHYTVRSNTKVKTVMINKMKRLINNCLDQYFSEHLVCIK